MRIGFVGVGSLARLYLRHLARLEQPVAAVCDLDEARVKTVAQEQGAVAYLDHHEMLEREALDAVFVAIPPAAHTSQVADAAAARCAVFVAKPVALDLDIARRTAQVIAETGVINQVDYMARYSDIALEARGLVRHRDLTLGFGRFLCRMSPQHPWWGRKHISGGQLVEQSTHVFDLLRYYLGEVDAVHAFGHRGAAPEVADFDDSTTVNLRFRSGAVGSVVSSFIARAPEGFAVELCGRDLFLRIAMDNRLTGFMDGGPVDVTGEESGYLRQIEQFVRAVRENNQNFVRSSYEDATRTLAVTLAATRSLETGAVEPVPDPFASPAPEDFPAADAEERAAPAPDEDRDLV
jgi:predicted dehydrogenase